MTNPQATKRPLPTDMRMWVREVTGIFRFISRMDEYKAKSGEEWAIAQYEYYQARMADLLLHPPKLPTRFMWNKIKRANKCLTY